MRLSLKPSYFLRVGLKITYGETAGDRCYASDLKSFRALFYITPSDCALLWAKIRQQDLAPRAKSEHLLWALLWLKLYAAEEVLSKLVGVDEDTYRERVFEMVQTIAKLKPHYVSAIFIYNLFGVKSQACVSLALLLFRSSGRIDTATMSGRESKPRCLSTAQTS